MYTVEDDELAGLEVHLAPLGAVRVTGRMHRGRLFELYAAEHRGRPVCLKTPTRRPSPGDEDGAYDHRQSGNRTNLFASHLPARTNLAAEPALLDALLSAEAQRVRDTDGRWNHAILAQGVWDPRTTLCRDAPESAARLPLAEPGRLRGVLVMPLHRGRPLSSLDPAARRRSFPRMLPALWDALGVAAHGDLSPDNLLCDLDAGRFALIDPGVVLTSARRAGEWSEQLRLTTTNAAH